MQIKENGRGFEMRRTVNDFLIPDFIRLPLGALLA